MASLWQFRVSKVQVFSVQAQAHQAASLMFSFGCTAVDIYRSSQWGGLVIRATKRN
jgi:hypothetical protein